MTFLAQCSVPPSLTPLPAPSRHTAWEQKTNAVWGSVAGSACTPVRVLRTSVVLGKGAIQCCDASGVETKRTAYEQNVQCHLADFLLV